MIYIYIYIYIYLMYNKYNNNICHINHSVIQRLLACVISALLASVCIFLLQDMK